MGSIFGVRDETEEALPSCIRDSSLLYGVRHMIRCTGYEVMEWREIQGDVVSSWEFCLLL